MFKGKLNQITDFIKEHNSFFANGFGNAFQHDETGIIWADTKAGVRPIFPDDTLADYFYLRTDKAARLQQDTAMFPEYCGKVAGTVGITSVKAVAVVFDADADLLVRRLINVIALASDGIVISGCNWNREEVLVNEMRNAEEKDVKAALQRLKKQVIVSIDFTIYDPISFNKINCLPNICKSC